MSIRFRGDGGISLVLDIVGVCRDSLARDRKYYQVSVITVGMTKIALTRNSMY
jgi:hypothetical protein